MDARHRRDACPFAVVGRAVRFLESGFAASEVRSIPLVLCRNMYSIQANTAWTTRCPAAFALKSSLCANFQFILIVKDQSTRSYPYKKCS